MRQIDFLKEQITKTGYPLEIEISSILDTKWEVINTDSYFDSDEKIMRDIDIRAMHPVIEGLLPALLEIELIIECKKNEDFAWVFFTRPFEFNWEEGDIDGQYLDELQILTKNAETTQLKEMVLGETQFHYGNAKRVAVCFDEFYLQGKKKDYEKKRKEIFEAQNQLKKFISYRYEQEMRTQYQDLYRLITCFPCIVFDGQMFEAIVEKGETELKQVNYILLKASYKTSYSNWDQSFLIDVVQKDHFKGFLRILTRDINSLEEIVKKHRRRIEKETDRAISLVKPKIV